MHPLSLHSRHVPVSGSITLKVKTFITFMALFAGNIKALLGKWLHCPLPGFQWDQILSGLT